MKKLVVFLAVTYIVLSCFTGVVAEEDQNIPDVVFEVSDVDKNGNFTVDLIIYNATYKGVISTISYDKDIVVPIDFETKEPTSKFEKFAFNPTEATIELTKEKVSDWQLYDGSEIKDGMVSLVCILNTKTKTPNSVITENFQALAGKDGLKVATFNFKKLTDKEVEFTLKNTKLAKNGFMLINTNGMQTCNVTFKYVNNLGIDNTQKIEAVFNEKTSDETQTDEETKEKRVKARTNGTLILAIDNYATISDSVLKWIDKDNKKVVPYIKDSRTMVPLRYISEELGCKVSYDDITREITIDSPKTELIFKIDSLTYTNDGLVQTLDTPPEIKESRTFVPLRAVAEALNKSITWIEKDKIIIITEKNYPWAEENAIEKELYARAKYLMSPMLRDMAY